VRHVLGIDAGGTKTVGLLADETGQVVAEARAGGANLQTHGELEVEKVLDRVIEGVGTRHAIAAVCLGMAGVDRPSDEATVREILRRLGHRQSARVVNDATIALVAGSPERIGIVVLAGTGSIAYGVDRAGQTARSGGYGFLLADEGSGYWLGHQALRAAVRGIDGRGEPTQLAGLAFDALGIRSLAELVPIAYEKGFPKYQLASLAALVETAAALGDRVAGALLRQAAEELSLAARAVARQLSFGEEPYPVVLAGGVFRACPSLAGLLSEALALPGAKPAPLVLEPARGAVALALDLLDRP
jgi:N-acetylglucosamine kinase